MTEPPNRTDRERLAILAGLALGALHAAAFSPPIGAWWLQTLSMAALLALAAPDAAHGRLRRALAATAAFGVANFAAGLAWLHTSMHVHGGMPSALAAAAVLLFASYLALFPVGALLATSVLLRRPGRDAPGAVAVALAVGGAWGLAEMLRGWAFTGFPWLAVGYAHVDGPLAGLAPWVGVHGIGAAAAAVAALLGATARGLLPGAAPGKGQRPARALAAVAGCAAVLAGAAALGRFEPTRPAGEPVAVRLVQGNVPQQLKFDRARTLQAMDDYARMVESSPARLTVLPETAWTVPWQYTPPQISARLESHARRTGGAIAIGMPLAGPDPGDGRPAGYTNSVALLQPAPDAPPAAPGPAAIAGRYDKRHLVPFGEFVPPGFRWFVDLMNIPLGDFGRGGAAQAPFEVAGQRFAFNVCYEDLFGEELLPAIRGPGGATVLVNVSNIAWFGDSHALPQHLAIARMRTLETGRPMLRATNTGVTAAIDHRGRVVAALPPYTQGVLDVRVSGTEGLSFYVRAGNASPAALCALMLAAAGLLRGGRRNGKR